MIQSHGLLLESLDNKQHRHRHQLKIKHKLLSRLLKALVEEVLVGVNQLQAEDLLVAEVVEDEARLLLK
jgi:alanyl-tRNA synthetase